MRRSPNNRLTIAFFTTEIEGEYSTILCQGALDYAEKYDVNMILFPGKAINSPYQYQHQYNVIYDLVTPHNVDALIIPLSIFNNLSLYDQVRKFCSRYSPLPIVTINMQIPGTSSIIIDNKKGLRDLLSHMIQFHQKKRIAFIQGTNNNFEADQRFSVYCDLLQENGIPFDPDLVCPGDFTMNAVPGALHLLFDKRNAECDAICAANDEMALATLTLLHERGIRVPEDIAVIGFDNVDGGRLSTPPLSTVKQPIYEMGSAAVAQALALLAGAPVSTLHLPTEMLLRKSCGCAAYSSMLNQPPTVTFTTEQIKESTPDIILVNEKVAHLEMLSTSFSQLFTNLLPTDSSSINSNVHEPDYYFKELAARCKITEHDFTFVKDSLSSLRSAYLANASSLGECRTIANLFDRARLFFSEYFQMQEVLRWANHNLTFRNLRSVLYGMFPFVDNKKQSVIAAAEPLKTLGIRHCSVYLYGDELFFPPNQTWSTPEKIYLAMTYSDEQNDTIFNENDSISTTSILLNSHLPRNRRYSLIVNPLFFLNYQMGIIVCELNLSDRLMYESLFVEMGCVLKFSHLITAKTHFELQLRDALYELQTHNTHLNTLSQTDELTGLFNRRGFLTAAGQSLQMALQRRASGMLVYADLDGLKIINDTFGHEEGDCALMAAASLLKKTFRSSDIIARLGGDEFTVFTVDTTPDSIDAISKRLSCLIDTYNSSHRRGYRVSISFGAVAFPLQNVTSIEELLAEADRCLYRQKREKNGRSISPVNSNG